MQTLKVKLTFTEEVLGTASNDPEIHEEYIASKAPNGASREEEVAAIGTDEVIKKAKTVFPRNEEDRPILYDYQIKGFFKDACSMLQRVTPKNEKGKKDSKNPANESSKIVAYKKVIDGMIFAKPRMIELEFEGKVGSCQRPIRCMTPQGERTALANSETVPAGTTISFDIICLSDEHMPAVKEWLDYGMLRGIGQWRNSGKGSFTWSERD